LPPLYKYCRGYYRCTVAATVTLGCYRLLMDDEGQFLATRFEPKQFLQ
jgi:hypothetical protein